jgi:hypothetical protein
MNRSFVVALATGFALIAGVGAGADARAQDDKPTSPPPQQEPPAKKPADPAKPDDPATPADPAKRVQEKPAQEPPAQGQPAHDLPVPGLPINKIGSPRRPSGASQPVASIDQLRKGRTMAVARSATVFDLDLSAVDWKSDPLLLVDGTPITRAQLDRQLCLILGANEIDQFITAILLRRLKKEMAAKGVALPTVSISEADVQKKFDEDKKVLPGLSGMTAEQYEKMIKEQFGWDHYVEFQKVQLEFERVLLPDPTPEFLEKQTAKQKPLDEQWKKDKATKLAELAAAAAKEGKPPPRENDPAVIPQLPPHPIAEADLSWIPATTWELMDARFVKSIQDNYAAGHEMHPLIRQSVVMTMRANLLKTSSVAPAPDEDPENFIFVGDEPVKLKEILALVSVRADDAVRRNALRELVNLRAADKRLDAEHAQETRAQSDEALQAVEKQYENSIIPLAQAVRLYGFNSVWHYRPFFARKHAYKTFLAKSTSEENLRAHYDEDGRLFFESGTVLAQALFVPGTDRASSKAAMDALFAEIVAGKPFTAVSRDPAKNKFPDSKEVKQGNIPASVRTKLRMALGESEYVAWLTGYSAADEAFYVAKEDSVVGPVWRDYSPSLTGWLALHVEHFFTTGQRQEFEKARENVLEDLVDLTFPRWVNESVAKLDIQFPKKG